MDMGMGMGMGMGTDMGTMKMIVKEKVEVSNDSSGSKQYNKYIK